VAKVFLIAQPSVSREGHFPRLEGLAEFGEVHTLLPDGNQPSFRPGKTMDALVKQLTELYSAGDYLVWAGGDTLAAFMAGVVMERLGVDEITWLRYDRPYDEELRRRTEKGARYVPVKVTLYNMDGKESVA